MSNEYFKRRVAKKAADYEELYWGRVVDPDGKLRDRRGERDQHLSDIRDELAFLDSLPHGRILDVGCGLGFLLSALASGWEKHGVEVSEFAAKLRLYKNCDAWAHRRDLTGVDLFQGVRTADE